MWRGTWLCVMAVIMGAACGPSQPAGYPGQVSVNFDGGKQLILVADYSVRAEALGLRAWAQVDPGTAGTIDLAGPWHVRCAGIFVKPPPGNVFPETLPGLDIGEGWETAPGFHAPPGRYTATLALPAKNVSVTKSFDAGPSIPDATGTFAPPGRCFLVS